MSQRRCSQTVSARPDQLGLLHQVLERQARELSDLSSATFASVGRFGIQFSRPAADVAGLAVELGALAGALLDTSEGFLRADAASLGFDRAGDWLNQQLTLRIDAGSLGLDAHLAHVGRSALALALQLADAGALGLDAAADAEWRARLIDTVGMQDLGLLPASMTRLDLMVGSMYELSGIEFEVGYGDGQVHPLIFLEVITPILLSGKANPHLLDRNYAASWTEQQAVLAALNVWVSQFNNDIVNPTQEAELILATHSIDLQYPGALDFNAESLVMADVGPAVLGAIEILEWAGFGVGTAVALRGAGRIAAGRFASGTLTSAARTQMRNSARNLILDQVDVIMEVVNEEIQQEMLTALSESYEEELGVDLEELVGIAKSVTGLWQIGEAPTLAGANS
jgi:hypothetical protein